MGHAVLAWMSRRATSRGPTDPMTSYVPKKTSASMGYRSPPYAITTTSPGRPCTMASPSSPSVSFSLGTSAMATDMCEWPPYVSPLEPNPHLLWKYLIARRFVVRNSVHFVPEFRERKIHTLASAALIAERPMLGNAVPGIVGELLFEVDLCWRVESLLRDTDRCH